MGKAKGGNKGGKGASKAAATAPKCTCDHPYQCDCGNRPDRPSKGHKWDPETQQWGGKGHKQKGASGQSGAVGQQAKKTEVGQTRIEQWQKLPSALLFDFCQKQKRPPPKFKEIQASSSGDRKTNPHANNQKHYKVRCIVPDAKDRDNDLILIPAQAVSNEEQAKEESALLALLQLTPSIPHERKLPEPYKTTWLTALQAQKQQQKQTQTQSQPATNRLSSKPQQPSVSLSSNKATANTNLTLGTSYTSVADRRKQNDQKKQARNARIRRHEAIRMANRDHPVFLTAKLRNQIQQLLTTGELILDTNNNNNNPADDDPAFEDAFASDRQQYVEERLHQEGFTKRQARMAFDKLSTKFTSDDENHWELLYDECLQWLCVHLPEDQLPEGFDPAGQTPEVVAANSKASTGKANATQQTSSAAKQISRRYGLLDADAAWLLARSKANSQSVEETLWNKIVDLASTGGGDKVGSTPSEEQTQILQDELEALEAMFPEGGLQLSEMGSKLTIRIEMEEGFHLTVVLDRNHYPSSHPDSVLCSVSDDTDDDASIWSVKQGVGVGFHVELVRFLATSVTQGEPMLFEIYSQCQMLQQTMEELPSLPLLETGTKQTKAPKSTGGTKPNQGGPAKTSLNKRSNAPKLQARRPRERAAFWAIPASKTPSADAFPKLGKSMEMQRKGLPAGKARQDFLDILRQADRGSRVVLVTGDTGCGKTTQIPQFILEEAPDTAKIVVAQPRRLAATGVAARVAQERGEDRPGQRSVGYVVRGDSAMCKSTRLLFCTFGILLRQMQCQGSLDCISHIVIDEVHERNLDADILMALLKQSLHRFPNLRIILMSATLDADRFAAYWGNSTPRMHIPGRTFPVQDFYLEDVLEMTGYNPPKKRKKHFGNNNNHHQTRRRKATPWDDSEMSDHEEDVNEDGAEGPTKDKGSSLGHGHVMPLEERLKRVDESQIDYDMLGQLVKHLVQEKAMGSDGSILVFLPGAPEINQAKIVVGKIAGGLPIHVLPLHGGLQPKDQNIVFRPSPNAVKVILSTNVAETSITIPDCTVVIDGCREKQSSYDPVNRMPLLIEVFASKASIKQRRGRAGRVREGKCYKLVSRATHTKLHDHTAPEITRCALDQTLLALLFLGVESGGGTFMQTLLDPPKKESLDAAVDSLWMIGAIEKAEGASVILTPLGMHLAGIPAPPVVGKMLVMGSILGCRRAALAMAAGISTGRSPFLRVDTPRNSSKSVQSIEEMKQQVVLKERANLFEEAGNSDHAMLAAAFMNWEALPAGGGDRKKYCDRLGLSFIGMKDILQLVKQYDSALSNAGYHPSQESDRNIKSWRILRACAVSAMSPGQLVRVQRPSTKYASTAEGAKEKDGVAKELKFFIRQETLSENETDGGNQRGTEERVFIHPSSALFSVGNYNCPWLVYHSMVKTSKPFLRDATECSAYALLLFGGNLHVEARNNIISVDNWVKLSANARIGGLIRGLRGKMDDLLADKIKNPTIDISGTPEMQLIVRVLISDGLGS